METEDFSYKIKATDSEDWGDWKEVAPRDPEPKKCLACGNIFLPKWHTARRCDWCRKNKIPVVGEEVDGKPF